MCLKEIKCEDGGEKEIEHSVKLGKKNKGKGMDL